MGPIDYTLDVATPFQAALQGYQAGAVVRDDQLKQKQMQQAQAQQAQQQEMLRWLAANPTAENYAKVMTLHQGMAENLNRAWTVHNMEGQKSLASDLLQWGSAIKSGRTDYAHTMMMDRATALENSGSAGKAKAMRDMANAFKENPSFALGQIQALLSANPNGKQAADALTAFGTEQRAEEQAPAELAKKEAEAGIKTAEAAAANQRQQAELLNLGATYGLTTAQTQKTLKETEKLGTEIQKAALELGSGGAIDPEKRFDFESKLRKEFSTQTAGFQETREAYERIKASQDNAVGDLSLIFAYMKMLDPGSVVREGEFANAQNAAGVPERVMNIYNKIVSGERLTSGQRTTFKGQAKGLLDAASKREATVRAGIDQVVKSYRLNPDNVFYEPSSASPAAPASATSAAPNAPPALAGRKWMTYAR